MMVKNNLLGLFIILATNQLLAQNLKAFYIGHSLSDQIAAMVKSLSDEHANVSFDWRYQSIPGSPLFYQWDRQLPGNGYDSIPPNIYSFFSPGEGLPVGNFDVLVLTESVPRHWGMYGGMPDTYAYTDSFYQYFESFNPDKQLYLYEVWHCINSGTPTGCMYDVNTNPWRQRLIDDHPMWRSVLDTINTRHNPTLPMLMIPGGQGLAYLYDSIQAGAIPNITHINQLFSDDIHLTDVGKYFIACIHFASIHKTSPVGLTNQLYDQWGTPFTPPTLAQAAKFQEIAWQVVTDFWQITGVNPPQVQAVVNATPTSGTSPLTVNFDGSNSTINSGGTLTYNWDFGDGSPTAFDSVVSHTYTSPAVYTSTLTVSDGLGNTSSATVAIAVSNPPNPSECSYLAYDGMDYSQNTPLHGQNGGVGFQAAWQVQNDDVSIPGYQVPNIAGSLTYSNLQTEGNRLTGGYNFLASGRGLETSLSGPFAAYVTPGNQVIGANNSGDTLWVSTLIQKSANDDNGIYVEWHSNNLAWCNLCPNTQRIGLGYYGTASNVNGQKRWSLSIDGTTFPTNTPLNVGSTALLVARMIFNPTNTVIDVFINPTAIGNNDPGTPTLSHTTTSPHIIRSIGYYGGSTAGSGYIDELRMASQYKCVTPDPSITFEELPTAIIAATPTSGVAPLTVMLDGTTSTDPAGGGLSYNWDFGDNSPNGSSGQESHIYHDGGGQVTVTLTVTDINGNSNSTTQTITIFNENGTFPCLSNITSLKEASCNQSDAQIRINLQPNTSATLSLNGTTIPPTSGTTYTQLAPERYQLSIVGSNGCSEDYFLTVTVDSSTCHNWQPAQCAMEIGTNLTGFADWASHRAMRNFLKNSRGEAIPYTTVCNCWSFDEATNEAIVSQMTFDTSGYPTYIPQATTSGDILLRYFVSSDGQNMVPGQTYVILYDGSGTIEPSGSLSNIISTPGRIQFDLGGDGTFWFQITQSTLGNHIRNIRVLRLADENQDIDNFPFYNEFLNKIEPFSVLRFMDWQQTNNNPLVQWSDRTIPSTFSYGVNTGAPYELIIQLANQLQKDIWICVPHAADDDFITQMATLFKNQLDTNLIIYLEYSNEVWNWIFDQAHYNNANRPFDLNYGRAAALKAKNVFDIWHNVFTGQECRVKRVLGIQAGFNYLNEEIMAHLDQDDWDYGSPTHYFGLDHDTTGVPRLDILGANATVADVMTNAMNNFLSFKELVKQDYRNIKIFNKKIITYEGGQHFVGNVFGNPYSYQQAMWDAQSSQLMYDMYNMMHDSIKTWGCKLACNFSLAAEQESVYGSWGVLDHIDIQPPYISTAPKYQALLDNLPDTMCQHILTWNGQESHLWSNVCNWDKSRLPHEESIVHIPADVPYHPQVDVNALAKSVITATNAILEVMTGFRLDILD